MKQIYIITYDNAQWCGGEMHCLVMASNESEAEELAWPHMEETQLELFSGQDDNDEPLEEGDTAVGSIRVELLKGSEYEEYVNDPSQVSFYPKVNF